MKMNIRTLSLIGLMAMLFLTACSTEPVYYSKSEVKSYVREQYGWGCKLLEEVVHENGIDGNYDADEGQACYEYIFESEDGFQFSVISYTRHITFDASTSIFYEEALSCDFGERFMEYHKEAMQEIIDAYAFETEISGSCVFVDLESYKQLSEVAELFVQLDEYLDYRYSVAVYVDIKPNIAAEYNENGEYRGNHVAKISTSMTQKERKTLDEVYIELEKEFVLNVKEDYQKGRPSYEIPDELWYAYPAPSLKVVSIAGVEVTEDDEFSYGFIYDGELESYTIRNLDPCQDFEEFPYNYTEKGLFAYLVKCLGGKYVCDDWKAVWKIGENTWTAKLYTKNASQSSYEYDKLKVYKNDEKIKLTDIGERRNGTVSGRVYTVEDLEQMLGVTILIDEKEMTIEIQKTEY